MRVVDVRDVPVGEWAGTVLSLREEGYAYFDWLTAVDETDREGDDAGFDVVCHLLDPSTPTALRRTMIRTRVPEGAALASITGVFRGAAWHERETHEMFGLGFEGTPLRKSFVLAARASKQWPGAKEPGESEHSKPTGRRRVSAPGVPDPEWGPR